jgi:rhamnose transport system ATP-binding protein
VFIGHRLEEVFQIADRITVLRDGRLISSALRQEVTTEGVIRDMVGRQISEFFAKSEVERGPLLMSVQGLGKEAVFSDVSFDVYQGEVLGFAGLIGAGRTNVGLALFGVEPADTGQITFQDQPVKMHSPEQALQLGIAYVTEDRRQLGLVLPMSLTTNITLPMLPRYLNRLGLVRRREEAKTARAFQEKLSIRAPSLLAEVGKLSGGNQQKVVLSKWLNAEPKLLILDEPTRGIDVRTKAEVHHIISDLAAQGMAIILISSDLPEVLAMSDRVVVMREGRQMATLTREEATQERVMTAAMGQSHEDLETRA